MGESLAHHRHAHSRFTKKVFVLTLFTLVLFVSVPFVFAVDPPSLDWSRIYTGLQTNSIIQTSDGGYAIAGQTSLTKLDSYGNLQWEKAFNGVVSLAQRVDSGYLLFCENGDIFATDSEGSSLSRISAGVPGALQGFVASDGNYVVIGNALENGEVYAWLRKIAPQGAIVWNMKFTGGYHASTVVETDDRGCALAGNSKTDFWLCKLDSNGNQQWNQIYTSGGITDLHFVYSMTKTIDGGFVLAGAGDWQSSGGIVPWLIKIDSQGHEKWDLQYSHYPQDGFCGIVQTADEGFLVAQSSAARLIRLDSSRNELWTMPLGPLGASSLNCSSLIRTNDGGYATAGSIPGSSFLVKISPERDWEPPVITISSPEKKIYETKDIPLSIILNEQVTWVGYSLDGESNVTISGNTTLTGLTVGGHNLTVYARDLWELTGASTTIQFTISARFPTEMVFAGIGIGVAVAVTLWLYVKRQAFSDYRKRDVKSFLTKRSFKGILSNRLVLTLMIISLSFILIFVQIFFPFLYYSSFSRNSDSSFEVGVTYVYEQDTVGQIYDQVERISRLGFKVIRVNLVCDSNNPSGYLNTLSDVFFAATQQSNVKVALIINNHESPEDISYYLGKWGMKLAYIQILNEPDVATSWDMGALFTDDEINSKFEEVFSLIEQFRLPALRYTNFGPAFAVRTNLPIQFSTKLDFVGFDVFMDSFLTISPVMIQLLQKTTHKEIVIAEYGMSTYDDAAQSDYLIRGLTAFKNMGLRGCWLVYWNSVDNKYGIRGRLAEQMVGEWIAKNT